MFYIDRYAYIKILGFKTYFEICNNFICTIFSKARFFKKGIFIMFLI